MKAAIYREFGSPDVLGYEDIDDPIAGPGEIVVEVHAVTVNRVLDCAFGPVNKPSVVLFCRILVVWTRLVSSAMSAMTYLMSLPVIGLLCSRGHLALIVNTVLLQTLRNVRRVQCSALGVGAVRLSW